MRFQMESTVEGVARIKVEVDLFKAWSEAAREATAETRRATPKDFWSYQSSSPTPSLKDAVDAGAIHPKTTQQEWESLSPGMRREIVRSSKK